MNDAPSTTGGRLSLFGAVLAGGLASACCLGPLMVVLLGLGSASAFIGMEPYRPIFAIITFALIAWAVWSYWQRKKQCIANGCPPKKAVMLWTLGGLALLMLFSPSIIPLFV